MKIARLDPLLNASVLVFTSVDLEEAGTPTVLKFRFLYSVDATSSRILL